MDLPLLELAQEQLGDSVSSMFAEFLRERVAKLTPEENRIIELINHITTTREVGALCEKQLGEYACAQIFIAADHTQIVKMRHELDAIDSETDHLQVIIETPEDRIWYSSATERRLFGLKSDVESVAIVSTSPPGPIRDRRETHDPLRAFTSRVSGPEKSVAHVRNRTLLGQHGHYGCRSACRHNPANDLG